MQSEDIVFDLFKRNLDTRRTVIIAVLATVTAFGAWVIQQVTAEKPLFNFETPVGRLHFACSAPQTHGMHPGRMSRARLVKGSHPRCAVQVTKICDTASNSSD
jgi:hypothetical protein